MSLLVENPLLLPSLNTPPENIRKPNMDTQNDGALEKVYLYPLLLVIFRYLYKFYQGVEFNKYKVPFINNKYKSSLQSITLFS